MSILLHGEALLVWQSLGISIADEELALHPLYLIPKLQMCPYQPCSISKCSPRNMQTISMHSINDKSVPLVTPGVIR
jgi:hypothetical protein